VASVLAVVAEFVAAFGLTPACTSGPATPALLGTCIGLTACALVLPAAAVGLRSRPLIAVLVGLGAAAAPAGFLVHFATTPQSGFCF
jgi:hypothetical protein